MVWSPQAQGDALSPLSRREALKHIGAGDGAADDEAVDACLKEICTALLRVRGQTGEKERRELKDKRKETCRAILIDPDLLLSHPPLPLPPFPIPPSLSP